MDEAAVECLSPFLPNEILCYIEDFLLHTHTTKDKVVVHYYINAKRKVIVHRGFDRPAVIFPKGRREWHNHGVLHRLKGPALIRIQPKSQQWYVDGELMKTVGTPLEQYIRPLSRKDWRSVALKHELFTPNPPKPKKKKYKREWWPSRLRGSNVVTFDKTEDGLYTMRYEWRSTLGFAN